jgi:hypothetical protein
MMANDYAGKIFGLVALAATAIWGIRTLVELRASGPAHGWISLTYCLVALSALLGGRAAVLSRNKSSVRPMVFGFLCQAIASFAVVAVVMGGGASAWTLGFWIVSSAGWIPGYLWFAAFFAIVISFFPKNKCEAEILP